VTVPARHSDVSSFAIDLGAHFNGGLQENWHGDQSDNGLASLPKGWQRFAGTQFDVRGLIQLGSPSPNGGQWFPTNISGIRIGLKCRRLHFLHGAILGVSASTTSIGGYVLHYEGGKRSIHPIVQGQDLLDWWQTPASGSSVVVAWKGSNAKSKAAGKAIRLYKSTWENPRPDVEITTLDFVSSMSEAAPFCVAITAEQ
jgi:hypothetical protein